MKTIVFQGDSITDCGRNKEAEINTPGHLGLGYVNGIASRLLLETDAPYLAPVPHRGKRCDSAMIAHVLDFLASIRPESREELERITWENAVRFYRL